jgi:hypothetical protein
VNFKPTAEEWLLWAQKSEIDSRVIDFINENRLWLDKDPDAKEGADTGLDKTPDRRAWERVSDVIKNKSELKEIDSKIISSIVGPKAASVFIQSSAAKRLLTGREVLSKFNTKKIQNIIADYGIHQLSVINEGIYRCLEVEKVSENDKAIFAKNISSYFEFLTDYKKEAAAHFAMLYTKQTYPHAIEFVATNNPILVQLIILYVNKLK